MKKNLLMIMLFALALAFGACSSDDDSNELGGAAIPYENLPAQSKQFITDHFVDYNVSETLDLSDSYSVLLNKKVEKATVVLGNYKVEFNRKGEWIKIEGLNNAALPDNVLALIPRSILSYVSQNYQGKGISEIEKESYGYKIELTGKPDIELKFNLNGGYLGTDGDSQGAVVGYDQLPETAKAFLDTHFGNLKISKVKKDNDSYDVEYTNGTEVEFDLSGNWRQVEVDNKVQMTQSILALLPKPILDYISSNHSSKKIECIKNNVSTYKIELKEDIELVFDKDGNLWGSGGNNNNNDNGQRPEFATLPQAIQSFLTEHFLKSTTFLYAKKDDGEYEVKLANGTEIEFTLNGDLKTVEVLPGNSVPDSVILRSILSYVKSKYPYKKIEEYEKKTRGYKVELSGYPELELIFDSNGNFKEIDR